MDTPVLGCASLYCQLCGEAVRHHTQGQSHHQGEAMRSLVSAVCVILDTGYAMLVEMKHVGYVVFQLILTSH